jgi:imidazolonepropionase
VAAAGGGILRTVGLTRAASEEDLYESARVRLERHAVRGVTTVEIKTGYGLSLDDEIKLIRVVESLRNDDRVSVIPTLLACHVVPKEWRERREDWIALVCDELITRVGSAGLAQFCDVFVEAGAYTADEARRVAGAARRVGLGVKLHVDQLGGAPGGAALAAELGAVSADHLEHADESGLRAMAGAGVVAVLLPGATAFLGERPADGRRMRALGVRVAVASDWNPGTCPTGNLWLMATLACTQSGLTVEEALRAITVEAAAALGGADGAGRLVTGAPGDLVVLDVARPEVVPYLYGDVPVRAVVRGGRTLWQAV